MFTGYQYFVYFHTKTSHIVIEKVQNAKIGLQSLLYLLRNILIRIA